MRRAHKLVGTRVDLRARVKEAEVKAVARDLLWVEACERADRAERLRNAERALFVEVGGPGTWAVLVEKSKHPDHAALWEEYQAALSAYEGGN